MPAGCERLLDSITFHPSKGKTHLRDELNPLKRHRERNVRNEAWQDAEGQFWC